MELKNKLKEYIKNEMIIEFNTLQEMLDYYNYNCPEIEERVASFEDVKRVNGEEYVFKLNNKYYHINYDEALDIIKLLPSSGTCEEILKDDFKKVLIEKMEAFKKAYEDLLEVFLDCEFEANDYIIENYPFEESFDEYYLKISEWIDSTKEAIKK